MKYSTDIKDFYRIAWGLEDRPGFKYGGSWADWKVNYEDQMTFEEYLQDDNITKKPHILDRKADGGRIGFADNPLKNFTPGSGPQTGSALEADVNIKKVKKALNSIKKQKNKKLFFDWTENSDWYKALQKDLGSATKPLNREYTNLLINKTVDEYFPGSYSGKMGKVKFKNDMVVNSFVNHLKQVGEFDGQEKFAKVLEQFQGSREGAKGGHPFESINKAWKSWIAGEFEVEGINRAQLKKELKARGIDYKQIDNWTASAAQGRGVKKIEELKTLDKWNNSPKFQNKSGDEIRKLFEKKYPGSNFYHRVNELTHLKNTGKYISGESSSKAIKGIDKGVRSKWLKDSFGLQFQGNYSKMIKAADELEAAGKIKDAIRLKNAANKFFGADGIITKAAGEGEHALARSFDMLSPDHQLKINSLVSGDLNQFKKWNFDIPVKRYFDEYNLPETTKARKKELARLIEERRSVLNSLTGGDKKGMVSKGVVDFKYGNTITATSDVIPIDKIKNFKVEDLLIKGKGYEEEFLKIGQKTGLVDKTGIKSQYVEKPIKTSKWNKFVNSLPVKIAKGIGKAGVRTLGAAMPVIGPGMVAWGLSDVSKAHAAGLTDPDEMTVAYNFGPEIAQMWSDYKAKEKKATLAKEGLPEIDPFAAKDGGLSGVDQYILNRYK